MSPDLLELPWATLLALASGYAGYWVASTGLRQHHRQIDVLFMVTVYAAVATGVRATLLAHFSALELDRFNAEAVASAAAFLASLVIGALWRRFADNWVHAGMRRLGLSYVDDMPSAWVSLSARTDFELTQLTVDLRSGDRLHCNDTPRFRQAPFPLTLGSNGDVLMYVTHERRGADGEVEQVLDVHHPDWGFEITYIPAAEISRVMLRLAK